MTDTSRETSASRKATPLILALLTVLAASVAGQMVGAVNGSIELTTFAALAFAGAALSVAYRLNRPWWDAASADDIGPALSEAQPALAVHNAALLAMTYGWGAASLLGVYLGTPLRWQHGWQYAAGMAAIGLLIYLASRQFEGRWSVSLMNRLTWATLLHGWAAMGGAFWLIGSGKLIVAKADWAANVVFLTGAFLVAGLGALSLRTARILQTRASARTMGSNPGPTTGSAGQR